MKYARPVNAVKDDFFRAKSYEEEVASWFPHAVTNLGSNDKLDIWVPGFYLDVKERRATLTKKWPVPPGCRHEDAFVIDEVAIRKALEHHPAAFFLLRDVEFDRTFLARVDEVTLCPRVRVNREYGETVRGKLVVDMTCFRSVEQPETELLPMIMQDLASLSWRQAPCLFPTDEEPS